MATKLMSCPPTTKATTWIPLKKKKESGATGISTNSKSHPAETTTFSQKMSSFQAQPQKRRKKPENSLDKWNEKWKGENAKETWNL